MLTLMFNLLRKKPATSPPQIQVIPRDPCRITAAEWCSSPGLVNDANQILGNPKFRMMMDVCRTDLAAQVLGAGNLNLEGQALVHARTRGFLAALELLESLGRFGKPYKFMLPTWEEEEIDLPAKQP